MISLSSHPILVLPTIRPFLLQPWFFAGTVFKLKPNNAIADSGGTQIFVMDGTPVINKRRMMCPLKVSLANGRKVTSTHMFDIIISGLPVTLMGHIIPELSVAFLFGICVLTAA
jgi:hypothetical protein